MDTPFGVEIGVLQIYDLIPLLFNYWQVKTISATTAQYTVSQREEGFLILRIFRNSNSDSKFFYRKLSEYQYNLYIINYKLRNVASLIQY